MNLSFGSIDAFLRRSSPLGLSFSMLIFSYLSNIENRFVTKWPIEMEKKDRTSHKRRLQHKLIYVSHLLKYCSHTISIALCDFVLWKLIDPRTRFIQLTCQLCREILTNDLATHLLCHTNVQCAGCMHTKHQMTLFININLERQIEWTERKVWTRQFAMEQIYFDMEHANTHTHTQMKETLSEYIVFDAMTLC